MVCLLNTDRGFNNFRLCVIEKSKEIFSKYPECRIMEVIAEIVVSELPVEPIDNLEENMEATMCIVERIVKNAYSIYKQELKSAKENCGQLKMFGYHKAEPKKQSKKPKEVKPFKLKRHIQESIEFEDTLYNNPADPKALINQL